LATCGRAAGVRRPQLPPRQGSGLTSEPYARDIIPVEPRVVMSAAEAKPFDCTRDTVRHPRETKA
jgi:hypothetical protein